MKTFQFFPCMISCLLLALLSSCGSEKLTVTQVAYQAIRPVRYKGQQIPPSSKIAVSYMVSRDGNLLVQVYNLTSGIMVIDQTQSFFIDSDGRSNSYYDPTVRSSSVTNYSSGTTGASVNLGAVGGALGVGGPIGTLLGGINVGGSNTVGSSYTDVTYFADQPKISLGPKGAGAMSKSFLITGVGFPAMTFLNAPTQTEFTSVSSPCKFSVCISYSFDEGKTFDRLVTDFYVSSQLVSKVQSFGRVNDALRKLYEEKPDLLHEPLSRLYFINDAYKKEDFKKKAIDSYGQGALWDFK